MTRDDCLLLADLAKVNTDTAPTAMRIMDGSATVEQQRDLAARLIDIGQRLHRRADQADGVVEGEIVTDVVPALPDNEP